MNEEKKPEQDSGCLKDLAYFIAPFIALGAVFTLAMRGPDIVKTIKNEAAQIISQSAPHIDR